MEFHIVGSISRDGCFLDTVRLGGGETSTTVKFSIQCRQSAAARIQWEQQIKRLEEIILLACEMANPVTAAGSLITEGADTASRKICVYDIQRHGSQVGS